MHDFREQLKPRGRVEIFVTQGAPPLVLGQRCPGYASLPVYTSCDVDFSKTPIVEVIKIENILVNDGKDKVIESLVSGAINVIARMAMGDRGTIPLDPTVPKSPVATMSALFNEVYRADIDAVVLNVGTPTVHEALFVKTFSAVDVPITSFSNQAVPVINEVGLITADLISLPLPRPPVAAPAAPPADEKLFSIRTFKSVPFESANQIAVTIRYTVFVE